MPSIKDLPWKDIGHGVTACEFRYEPEGQLHIAYRHECKPNAATKFERVAFSAVPVSPEGSARDWKLVQREPLTITPSQLRASRLHRKRTVAPRLKPLTAAEVRAAVLRLPAEHRDEALRLLASAFEHGRRSAPEAANPFLTKRRETKLRA